MSSTDPPNGATGVALQRDIAVVFSEAMEPSSINAESFTLTRGTSRVSGQVAYSGVTATFNPTSALLPNTVYTARITTGALALGGVAKNADGEAEEQTPQPDLPPRLAPQHHHHHHPLVATGIFGLLFSGLFNGGAPSDHLVEDYVWSFTTGPNADQTAPTVSGTSPVNGATGTSISGTISASFSESMSPSTINTTSFRLLLGSTPITGAVEFSGVTAVFNPANGLLPGTLYTARITTVAEDLAGNPLANDFIWSFTTGQTPDTTSPRVSATIPSNNSVGIAIGGNLAATFTEAMNPLTVNSTTFSLRTGLFPAAGSVNYSGVTAVFNPAVALLPSTLYTATITAGATDLAGNPLAGDFSWSFRTGLTPDSTPPTVSFTSPLNGDTGVALGRSVLATFSEAMHPLTLTPATFTLEIAGAPVLGVVSYAGLTATFKPVAGLLANTQYTATITTGAMDLAANWLEQDFVWSFTTGVAPDTTAPVVTLTDPSDGDTGAGLNRLILAVFSEAMDPLTINIDSFTLFNGTTQVPGAVQNTGTTSGFFPLASLEPNTEYTATITADATDLAGNHLAEPYVWSFTTGAVIETTAPIVISTTPADGAVGVPLNSSIVANFSETMNPLTLTTASFRIYDGNVPVIGVVTYSGTVATFNPVAALEPNTEYTATITPGATDLAGNPLAEPYVWSFTTGATIETTAPTVLSTTPADGAVGVPLNSNIVANFSEAMNPSTVNITSFLVDDGTVPVIGVVTNSGTVATFNPVADLEPNTEYTANITVEAKDLAGNALAAEYVWSFTTGTESETVAPTVLSTTPVDGALAVLRSSNIVANFSETMNPLTINATSFILDDGNAPVIGVVTYAGTAATFNPAAALASNTEYFATITVQAKDLAGNALAAEYVWSFTTGSLVTSDNIELGAANAFAILAGSTVTSTGLSVVNGDLGVSPGTAIEGFPPAVLVGEVFTGVASAAGAAKEALNTAFEEAAGRSTGSQTLPGDLGGLTFFPGLYTNSTSVMLSTGNVTLDAQGNENAVFLFQMGSTLTTGVATQVILAGGCKASNVYWQVGTSATLGTNSIFKGNILAQTAITLTTGANLEGRALTQTAAVTLDAATITMPAN